MNKKQLIYLDIIEQGILNARSEALHINNSEIVNELDHIHNLCSVIKGIKGTEEYYINMEMKMLKTENNEEMSRQILEYFNIRDIVTKLNSLPKEERMYYLNNIITTLVVYCIDSPLEAIGFLESLKQGIIYETYSHKRKK